MCRVSYALPSHGNNLHDSDPRVQAAYTLDTSVNVSLREDGLFMWKTKGHSHREKNLSFTGSFSRFSLQLWLDQASVRNLELNPGLPHGCLGHDLRVHISEKLDLQAGLEFWTQALGFGMRHLHCYTTWPLVNVSWFPPHLFVYPIWFMGTICLFFWAKKFLVQRKTHPDY